jgi:hypothetical protein
MRWLATQEFADKVRALKLKEPPISAPEIIKRLHLKCSNTLVQRIIYNKYLPDAEYWERLPASGKTRMFTRNAWTEASSGRRRLPSDECRFRCPVCGMGYPMQGKEPFGSQAEADMCCKMSGSME